MHRSHAHRHGFTLVELIVLVGVIGLVAAIAVPSFNGYLRANRIDVTCDQLSSDMALARSLAVAQGQVIRFEGESDRYRIVDPTDGRVIREREFAADVALGADVIINFFPWGAAEAATLNIANGVENRQVQVLPTGIVEVGP